MALRYRTRQATGCRIANSYSTGMNDPDTLSRWLLSQMPEIKLDTLPGVDPDPSPDPEPDPDPDPLPAPQPAFPSPDPGFPIEPLPHPAPVTSVS
jgi:hypothetical protein